MGAIRQGHIARGNARQLRVLSEFWLEEAFWQKMGQHINPVPLYKRPYSKVRDYMTILEIEAAEDRRKQSHESDSRIMKGRT